MSVESLPCSEILCHEEVRQGGVAAEDSAKESYLHLAGYLQRFSILSCKSTLGEGRLSGTGCLTLGASNFNSLCGDTRLLRTGAEVQGERQQHTDISGKPQRPRTIVQPCVPRSQQGVLESVGTHGGVVQGFSAAQSQPFIFLLFLSCG